jgi:phospholipid/cholesterol/gamma-HCH transport system substrate-binding protein
MLVCLYLGVNYLKGKEVFSGDKSYYALYDQTGGLQTSSPVLLRGVKIGSVTAIELDGAQDERVRVTVGIKKSIRIPDDSRLKLFSNGLMGGKAIELVLGSSANMAAKNSEIASESESDILTSATLSLDGIVVEATRMMNSLEATSNSINAILSDNAGSISGTLANLDATSRQLASADIGRMLDDMGAFTAVLKNNSAKFDAMIGNFEEVSGELASADLGATVDSLTVSINHFNAVLAGLSEGEGSAGRLLADPALYDSLTAASGNLSALLADLKENPKKYVHFSLFGRKK